VSCETVSASMALGHGPSLPTRSRPQVWVTCRCAAARRGRAVCGGRRAHHFDRLAQRGRRRHRTALYVRSRGLVRGSPRARCAYPCPACQRPEGGDPLVVCAGSLQTSLVRDEGRASTLLADAFRPHMRGLGLSRSPGLGRRSSGHCDVVRAISTWSLRTSSSKPLR
jgi:hypothetical protein